MTENSFFCVYKNTVKGMSIILLPSTSLHNTSCLVQTGSGLLYCHPSAGVLAL